MLDWLRGHLRVTFGATLPMNDKFLEWRLDEKKGVSIPLSMLLQVVGGATKVKKFRQDGS